MVLARPHLRCVDDSRPLVNLDEFKKEEEEEQSNTQSYEESDQHHDDEPEETFKVQQDLESGLNYTDPPTFPQASRV